MEDNVIMKPLREQFQININPFIPKTTFLYPFKTSENRKVFWCFQGQRKGALGTNGLSTLEVINVHILN